VPLGPRTIFLDRPKRPIQLPIIRKNQLLKFAEHDFGGTDRQRAVLSAGARASAVTQAIDIGRSLAPKLVPHPTPSASDFTPEETTFEWRGGRVMFDPHQCGVVSLTDAKGREWVPKRQDLSLGEFKHTMYRSRAKPVSVFPEPLPASAKLIPRKLVSRRTDQGVQIMADFDRSGFRVESTWFFHAVNPWIDVIYRLKDGWSDDPQTVEFYRRFLQHVLPAGVHKVRYYGLWSPSNRNKLLEIQQTLTQPGNNQPKRLERRRYGCGDICSVRSQTMPQMSKGYSRLDRASASPREGTSVIELTLISSMLKFNPKQDPSGYVAIPVYLSGEKMPQINRRLCLIGYRSYTIGRPILSRARSKPTNQFVAHL